MKNSIPTILFSLFASNLAWCIDATITTHSGCKLSGQFGGMTDHETKIIKSFENQSANFSLKTPKIARIDFQNSPTYINFSGPDLVVVNSGLDNHELIHGKILEITKDGVKIQTALMGAIAIPLEKIVITHFDFATKQALITPQVEIKEDWYNTNKYYLAHTSESLDKIFISTNKVGDTQLSLEPKVAQTIRGGIDITLQKQLISKSNNFQFEATIDFTQTPNAEIVFKIGPKTVPNVYRERKEKALLIILKNDDIELVTSDDIQHSSTNKSIYSAKAALNKSKLKTKYQLKVIASQQPSTQNKRYDIYIDDQLWGSAQSDSPIQADVFGISMSKAGTPQTSHLKLINSFPNQSDESKNVKKGYLVVTNSDEIVPITDLSFDSSSSNFRYKADKKHAGYLTEEGTLPKSIIRSIEFPSASKVDDNAQNNLSLIELCDGQIIYAQINKIDKNNIHCKNQYSQNIRIQQDKIRTISFATPNDRPSIKKSQP